MINYHPTKQMLIAHSEGQLPLSLTIALSAHVEMCEQCAGKLAELTEQVSQQTWQQPRTEMVDFGDMMQSIMASDISPLNSAPISLNEIDIAGKHYTLPLAFRKFETLKWSGFGPINRARIVSDEGDVRGSLLHIDKNGRIPSHQHKGYELTLLLAGSFSDEHGSYQQGDFIWLEGGVTHSPFTEHGCLCYTVQDAPLHFMAGISKVLNPLGQLIY